MIPFPGVLADGQLVQEAAPEIWAEALTQVADAGFSREDPVDEHGEFCVRGGVVDLFPPGEAYPLRLEFAGDTIESVRRYDPATQRSIEPAERAAIVPVRETFEQGEGAGLAGVDRSATLLDFALSARAPRWMVAEPDDVAERARRLIEQLLRTQACPVALCAFESPNRLPG